MSQVRQLSELRAIVSRTIKEPGRQWTKAGKRHGRNHQMVTDVEIEGFLAEDLCRCRAFRRRQLRICCDRGSGQLIWARLMCCGFRVDQQGGNSV